MSTAMNKIVTLRSSDNVSFDVEEAVAVQSHTIMCKHMIEDDCGDNGIRLPDVTSKILGKVIEYCKKHVAVTAPEDGNNGTVVGQSSSSSGNNDGDLKEWDEEFVKELDGATLYNAMLAAYYLEIPGLVDLTCQRFADLIRGKKPEEIRTIFKLKNDFKPEEEAAIRRENPWAFD